MTHLLLWTFRDTAFVATAVRETETTALVVLITATLFTAFTCSTVVLAPTSIKSPVSTAFGLAPLAAAM